MGGIDASNGRFPFPLPDGWFQVGYGDELALGELRSLRYFDRELVMFRDDAGRARLLDAHCPHLGAHLGRGGVGGRVEHGRLRCPFHAWEFDGDGRCVRVPYAERIPPRAVIRSYPVEERFGLLVAWFDKQERPPSFPLPDIPEYGDPEWTDYYRHEWTVRSQAQELAENSVDPVHFRFVHGTAEIPGVRAWTEGPVFRANLDYPIAAGSGAMLNGTIDIHAHGLGIGVTYFRGIVETAVVIGGTPIDGEHVHQRLSFMVRRRESEEATRGLAQVFVKEIARQFEEDIPIWENKAFWHRPVLCDGDGPIAELRRWATQFYGSGTPGDRR